MRLDEYVAVVRRGWRSVVATTVVAMLLAALASFGTGESYRSVSSILFSVSPGTSRGDATRGLALAQQQIRSYAELVSLPVVLDPVIDELDLPTSAAELGTRVRARSPASTVIMEVRADAADPEQAAVLADAVARQVIRLAARLTPQDADDPLVRVSTVSPATVPLTPVGVSTRLNLAAGLLFGVLGGVVLAVQRDAWRQRSERWGPVG